MTPRSTSVSHCVNMDGTPLSSNTGCLLMPIMPFKGKEIPGRTEDQKCRRGASDNAHLRFESKISLLTIKPAKESYFKDDILKRYTPTGWQNMPTLPYKELNVLKMTVFRGWLWQVLYCFHFNFRYVMLICVTATINLL